MKEIRSIDDLAIHGAPPAFHEPMHVGRPNIVSRDAFLEHVGKVLDNQWLTNNGPLVCELERRIADYLGVKHCVAMCNGTIAHYMHAMLEPQEQHILELGAGSFRDMAELRRRGIDCEGMDFSPESVKLAKHQFPNFSDHIHQMSAFDMRFPDSAFDVSYHNGLWVLFDDTQLRALASEQARVTRYRMVATVHNAHNKQFVDYFDRLKESDPLYDIRFRRPPNFE